MLDIDIITMESEMNVCDSIVNALDKIDYMLEYDVNDEYVDDLVMEAYEIYLEATNRRKKADEIDQYIRDKKLGDINSKNSSKSKSARKMRNFLMNNDFDPKTGTIAGDAPNTRVDLELRRGKDADDAAYNYEHNRIKLGTGFTKKQARGQEALSHEKGHHVFNNTTPSGKPLPFKKDPDDIHGKKLLLDDKDKPIRDKSKSRSEIWRDKDIPEDKNERGIKHLDEAKAKGKYINSHDDGRYMTGTHSFFGTDPGDKQDPEELEADLHAAKTARIRTKYAGRKRAVKRSGATRNLNDNEIRKSFEEVTRSMAKDSIDKTDAFDFYIRPGVIEFMKKIAKGKLNISKIKNRDQAYDVYNNIRLVIDAAIRLHNKNDADKGSLEFEIHDKMRYLNSTKTSLQKYRELIEELELKAHSTDERRRAYFGDDVKKHNHPMYDDYKKYYKEYLLKLRDYLDLLKEAKSLNLHIDRNIHEELDLLEHAADAWERAVRDVQECAEGDGYREPEYYENQLKNATNEFNTVLSRVKPILLNYIDYAEFVTKLKKCDKEYKKSLMALCKVGMDESTEMRHDFVKKYVHEFFEDYYSLENFEMYCEGY